MAKVTGCLVTDKHETNTIELSMLGDTIPDSVYGELRSILDEYNGTKKRIAFVVQNPKMLLLIRQVFSGEYDSLELRQYADSLQALPNAV